MIHAFQWDLARQVERLGWLKAQLPRYADWGYTELYLHLEDAVEYPSLPGVARPDAYSRRQLGELVDAASRAGIAVVPIANLLGHTQYLVKVPALRDLNELRAPDGSPLPRGQICPSHPRTLEVADKLMHDLAPFCTAGKIHVGLDESFHLGRHPLSRAEIKRIGLAAHFAGHVGRLNALAGSFGLRLGYWADMLYFIPDAIRLLPPGTIAYDWYYYPFDRHPRVEIFNFAERDLARPLRARGIEYWGCPMNSGFRHEPMPVFGDRLANIRSWWRRCHRVDAAGILLTSWETSRIAAELPTVIDAAAASLWLGDRPRRRLGEGGRDRPASGLLQDGLSRVYPKLTRPAARAAAIAALGADRIAHAGYARWELDTRWDSAAGNVPEGRHGGRPSTEPTQTWRDGLRAVHAAPALAAGLELTRYFTRREEFVRSAAHGVFSLRRLLARRKDREFDALVAALLKQAGGFQRDLAVAGRAAEVMWRRTRPAAKNHPNRERLAADGARLAAWMKWLRRVQAKPVLARTRSPVAGAWQLVFTIENFAPALQNVVVEQRAARGGWTLVHERYTIEFRAVAARPKAGIRRETSVPLPSPDGEFRFKVRGTGEVRIGNARVTDGVTTVPAPGPKWRTIGRPAPKRGLPSL